MELNNILIASDFSKHADFALRRAVLFSEQHHSNLHFLHILRQPWIGTFTHLSEEGILEKFKIEKELQEKLLKGIKKYSKNLKIDASIRYGRPSDEIVKYSKEHQCEMIVVGAHGKYYINDYIIGTTASQS